MSELRLCKTMILGRKLSIILTVASTLFVVSCGPRNSKNIAPVSTSTFSNALGQCQSERPSEFSRALELGQTFHHQIAASKFLARNEQMLKFSIMTISRSELLQEATRLTQTRFGVGLVPTRDDFLALAALNEKIIRLEFMECNIGEYWQRGKVPFEAYNRIDTAQPSVADVISICSAFYSSNVCQAEAHIAISQARLNVMAEHYVKRFERQFYQPRFRFISTIPQVSCRQNAEETELIIETSKQSEADYARLSNALSRWVSPDQKTRVVLTPSSKNHALKILRKGSGPAHVNMNDRSAIVISPNHDSELILAHELGHILGFPDCYYEAWSEERQAFIYIELDPNGSNLMCTLRPEAHIPQDYFDQLKQAYCP